MAQCQGPHSQMVRLFLVLAYLARRFCKISKVPGAPRNVNPALSITWLVSVTIYCGILFFNNNSSPPCQFLRDNILLKKKSAEVKFSWTHFEVFGLGLEASSPRKLACPRLEDSTNFWIVKLLWSAWKIFGRRFFLEIAWKIFVKIFFLENTCACVLGPWLQAFLSLAEGLFLALASGFFVSLALASSVVSWTPPLKISSGKCSLNKLLNLNWVSLGPLAVHVLLQLDVFMTKQKSRISNGLFYYLLLKYCRRQCSLLLLTWANSLTKFNPKMQDFKRVLNCK